MSSVAVSWLPTGMHEPERKYCGLPAPRATVTAPPDEESHVEWAAFGVLYVIGLMSFEAARPRGNSDIDFQEQDTWSASASGSTAATHRAVGVQTSPCEGSPGGRCSRPRAIRGCDLRGPPPMASTGVRAAAANELDDLDGVAVATRSRSRVARSWRVAYNPLR
jgi:hypothetical protein